MRELTEFQNKILALYSEGKTMKEMAEALGKSESSITSSIYSMRKRGKMNAPKRREGAGIPKHKRQLTPRPGGVPLSTLYRLNPATGEFKKIDAPDFNFRNLQAALNVLTSCKAQLDRVTDLLKRP